MTSSSPSQPFRVAALYRFCRLDAFAALKPELAAFCCARGIKGTLILAREGINGTVAGKGEAIAELTRLGIRSVMLTGDAKGVAETVSKELGIAEFFAEVLPDQKSEKIKELQARGLSVAMVGDGVNDAPALVQADLGVAIGAGTDVAVESADVVLVRSDPRDVAAILGLSRATYRKMVQNLIWATGYNTIAIPMAAGISFGTGFLMTPAVAAVFMSASTVIVAINAQFLRFYRRQA